jgi:hypothetical protein
MNDSDTVDCLSATFGGGDMRFYFNPATGDLAGLEMQASDDQDPCTILFSDFRQIDGRFLPHHWIVRHGDDVYADLTITAWERTSAPAAAADGEKLP